MFLSPDLISLATIALASQAVALDLRGAPSNFFHPSAPTKNHSVINQVVNQKFNPHSYHVSGPAVYAKALHKFQIPVPSAASSAAAAATSKASQQGSVAAQPQAFDSSYLCPVQVGTPPQTMNLDFDTGSSDLWMFSSLTPSTEVKGQHTYNPTKSTTAKQLPNYRWSIGYGDGSSASGVVYTDVVHLGNLTVNAQPVEPATQVSSSFTASTSTDGLVGLGFQNLNTVSPTKQTPIYQTAKTNLTNYLFTANLKRGQPGTYNFGYIDPTQYLGPITYTPVNTNPGYWTFTSTGFAVGSAAFNSTPITAIADTGTTLLLLPPSITKTYYAAIRGAAYSNTYGAYVYPCSSSVPSFSFGVGSYRGLVPGSYMTYGQINSTHCYGGMQSISGPYAIFGDILLKSQFVVFDAGNTRLGFAAKHL